MKQTREQNQGEVRMHRRGSRKNVVVADVVDDKDEDEEEGRIKIETNFVEQIEEEAETKSLRHPKTS